MLFYTQAAIDAAARDTLRRHAKRHSPNAKALNDAKVYNEPRRPAPPLREQLLTGAKVFLVMGAVAAAIWFLDGIANR